LNYLRVYNKNIILGGSEKGIPHYRFNKKILLKEFKDFKILDFWIDSENYYCLLGQLKKNH
jgi:Xaa-Pro aminopeptidase